MERAWDAIVVGAGVIGSAVTYALARRGLRVSLVDRGAVASGRSSASAGHTSVQARVPGPFLELALANVRRLGPGFFLATGHDSIGVLHSTMTGQLLAEWIVTGRRPDLLATFDPARTVS